MLQKMTKGLEVHESFGEFYTILTLSVLVRATKNHNFRKNNKTLCLLRKLHFFSSFRSNCNLNLRKKKIKIIFECANLTETVLEIQKMDWQTPNPPWRSARGVIPTKNCSSIDVTIVFRLIKFYFIWIQRSENWEISTEPLYAFHSSLSRHGLLLYSYYNRQNDNQVRIHEMENAATT